MAKRPRRIGLVGFKVGQLKLNRGDVVVLKTPSPINFETIKRLKSQLKGALPPKTKILVLGDGLDLYKLAFVNRKRIKA